MSRREICTSKPQTTFANMLIVVLIIGLNDSNQIGKKSFWDWNVYSKFPFSFVSFVLSLPLPLSCLSLFWLLGLMWFDFIESKAHKKSFTDLHKFRLTTCDWLRLGDLEIVSCSFSLRFLPSDLLPKLSKKFEMVMSPDILLQTFCCAYSILILMW